MATHQEIAQVSDEELLERMINSYEGRFDEVFWNYFYEQVDPRLPDAPVMADIGCGPGLFLRDLSKRYPTAKLYGYDLTRVMVDYGEKLDYQGERPAYQLHDITEAPLPLQDGSVDMVAMVAVLHVLAEPLAACEEICRVLSPDGVFLLQDWVRTPLAMYIDRMTSDLDGEEIEAIKGRLYRLFPSHNKYTVEDWLWLLDQGGLDVIDYRELSSPHFRTFVCGVADR